MASGFPPGELGPGLRLFVTLSSVSGNYERVNGR